jgi:hypothetical protein
MKILSIKHVLLLSLFITTCAAVTGQSKMPDELTTGSIRGQIDYLVDHTRIYDNYRAIREDIFRKINSNILDTLSAERNRISLLNDLTAGLNGRVDSLNVVLASTKTQLGDVTATKNKIRVLGLEMNKTAYNTIMWILVGGLVFLLLVGFLIFKRNLVVLLSTEKDLKELKEEFATYRQTSRIAREKVEMDLFRANQKLKSMQSSK